MGGMTSQPAVSDKFGDYGGRFVPEALMHALDELAAEGTDIAHRSSVFDELFELVDHERFVLDHVRVGNRRASKQRLLQIHRAFVLVVLEDVLLALQVFDN